MILALLACMNSGQVVLDGGATGGDGAPDLGDTGEAGEEEPETHFAEGRYSGRVSAEVPEWDWQLCEGDLELEIDAEGALAGSGLCVEESNWGDLESQVTIEGTVDDEGEVEGTVVYEMWSRDGAEEEEAELDGRVDEDGIELSWADEVEMGGGGWSETVEILGAVEGERDD